MVLFALNTQAQVEPPLKLIRNIPLPGLHDGDFDHFQVDTEGQRLFLAAEENSAIEVIDLRTNKLIHTIKGPKAPKAPHSMAYDVDSKRLFVADDGGPNQVEIYDGTSYELLGAIPTDAHTDASTFDAANHLYYVGNGGRQAKPPEDYCMLSVIDTRTGKKAGDVKVDADRVEAMAIEKSGRRMFVNMYSKNAVAVIDREKREVIATWPITEVGKDNASMAFDEADHRLFVLVRDPGKLAVIDSDSGKIITTLDCVGAYDEATFDPASRRIYLIGVPFLKAFGKKGKGDRYDLLGQIPTGFHAETGFFVPEMSQLYVAVNHHGNTDAKVQVYKMVP